MMENSTQNDLIRFIYNDISPGEKKTLYNQILTNQNVEDEYLLLMNLKSKLDKLQCDPDPTSVELILEHSLALNATQAVC